METKTETRTRTRTCSGQGGILGACTAVSALCTAVCVLVLVRTSQLQNQILDLDQNLEPVFLRLMDQRLDSILDQVSVSLSARFRLVHTWFSPGPHLLRTKLNLGFTRDLVQV